jgi:hypothetical protein
MKLLDYCIIKMISLLLHSYSTIHFFMNLIPHRCQLLYHKTTKTSMIDFLSVKLNVHIFAKELEFSHLNLRYNL